MIFLVASMVASNATSAPAASVFLRVISESTFVSVIALSSIFLIALEKVIVISLPTA